MAALPGALQWALPWSRARLTKREARAVKIWAALLLLACVHGTACGIRPLSHSRLAFSHSDTRTRSANALRAVPCLNVTSHGVRGGCGSLEGEPGPQPPARWAPAVPAGSDVSLQHVALRLVLHRARLLPPWVARWLRRRGAGVPFVPVYAHASACLHTRRRVHTRTHTYARAGLRGRRAGTAPKSRTFPCLGPAPRHDIGFVLARALSLSAYLPTYLHLHTCMHTCIHAHMHPTYLPTYIHACIHTYMHTYMHTYIHTYISADIHTYEGFASLI